jgi:Homeodomain-like domain
MITVKLRADHCQRLEETFHTTSDRCLRHRRQATLMAARGRRPRQIAEALGISVRTLQHWLNVDQAKGIDGLPIPWASGRTPHSPESWAAEIVAWVTPGPAGWGLDRANWTDCRADHPPLSYERLSGQRKYAANLLYQAWRAALSPDVARPQS